RSTLFPYTTLFRSIHEIQHVHGPANLTEAFDATQPLLQTPRIPGQIHVDERTEGLQVEALARRVGGDHQTNVPVLDGFLDAFALHRGERIAPEDAALA